MTDRDERNGLAELARRIERAEAEQLASTGTPGRGAAREMGGGLVVWKGPGSPYSAAFGLGLAGRVGAGDLDAVEAHLAGGPVRIEVAAPAHPTLAAELARRRYRLERQLLVWCRPVDESQAERPGSGSSAGDAQVRPIRDGEEQAWIEVFARAFLGRAPRAASEEASLLSLTASPGSTCFAAFAGARMAGVAAVSAHGGVAILSGAGVLPEFRRRGLQLALVRARLGWASAGGAELAAATTAPGAVSQRALERAGFRCAYPKAVLVRE
jgi:hypothetical protein